MDRKIRCNLKKKKKHRGHRKKHNEKKVPYTLFPYWHHRVEKEKKNGKKEQKTSTVTRFTVGRANGPVIFHDALTSPLLSFLSATRFATRSSETKVENQSPRSSTHFNRELRGRDHASGYVESRWSRYRSRDSYFILFSSSIHQS